MRITVLGSGQVGRTLAAGIAAAGHDVVLGSRSPGGELTEWATGANVTTALPADAVRNADLIVNATPGAASVAAVRAALSSSELDGTVLLDVSNPLDFATGAPRLSTAPDDSVGEQLQREFPALRVVKSLCTVHYPIMIQPGMLAEPTTMFLAGNDSAAKQTVVELLRGLGWPAEELLDLGGIEVARQMEAHILFWFTMMNALGTPIFNIRIVRAE
jgi:predicted dinucleotide-binding enzyme